MNSAPAEHDIHGKHHLVLLAGLLCDRTIWEDVAARLSDLAIISIIDFAGFSTIEAMAEHVLGTAPQRFVLVGHSMGGRVALEVMRRAPGRVRGLGLFNTGVHPLASHEPASRGELVQLAHDIGMRKLADRWLPPMLDAHGSTSESLRSRLTAMVERASPAGFAKQIAALLNRPWGPPVGSGLATGRCKPGVRRAALSKRVRPPGGELARTRANLRAEGHEPEEREVEHGEEARQRDVFGFSRLKPRIAWRVLPDVEILRCVAAGQLAVQECLDWKPPIESREEPEEPAAAAVQASYSAGNTTSTPLFFSKITMNFAGFVVLTLRPTVCTSPGPS